MNNTTLICWDLETGSTDPLTTEPLQVAGQAYNPKTLEPISKENGGQFQSYLKPLDFSKLEPEALKINRITVEMLEKAPDQKIVWNSFINWINTFNTSKNKWGCPIAMGKNIRGFDMVIAKRMNQLHCSKKDKTLFFNTWMQVDLEDFLWSWTEGGGIDIPNLKMDTIRDYFGLSKESGHCAITDVSQTGELIIKFLKLYRTLSKRVSVDGTPLIKFKDSCKK